MSESKYRITRDSHNWIVEEYFPGGGIISRGKFVGREKKAAWKQIMFCGSLKSAAKSLLDRAAGDAVLSGEAASLLDAIRLAEERTIATLEAMTVGGSRETQAQTQE